MANCACMELPGTGTLASRLKPPPWSSTSFSLSMALATRSSLSRNREQPPNSLRARSSRITAATVCTTRCDLPSRLLARRRFRCSASSPMPRLWRPFSVPPSKYQLWTDSPRFRSMCEAVLATGNNVRFHVSGQSMQPNLLDGDVVVVAPARHSELRRGDVILSHDHCSLRVHRLVSESSVNVLTTRGDSGIANDPDPQRLLGRLVAVERNGRCFPVNSPAQKAFQVLRLSFHRLKLAASRQLRRLGAPLLCFGLLACLSLFIGAAPAAAQADLAVTADTAAPSPIAAGGQITYTVTVINNGPGTANVPTVTMATPANTTFVSAVKASGGGTWNLTSPPVGGTGNITFTRTTNMVITSTTTFTFVVQVVGTAANG